MAPGSSSAPIAPRQRTSPVLVGAALLGFLGGGLLIWRGVASPSIAVGLLGLTIALVGIGAASRARFLACGACHLALLPTTLTLPAEIAQPLADALTARGSLDPARPNHLPQPGQPTYCLLDGLVCPHCRRCGVAHVALGSATQHDGQRSVSLRPLSGYCVLEESSAVFLATLALGGAVARR